MAPIYEFSCSACGKDFEIIMKPWDPVECVHCKAREVDKKFAVTAKHIWTCSTDGAMPKRGK
jgi:putative FmdB family regulatory protein